MSRQFLEIKALRKLSDVTESHVHALGVLSESCGTVLKSILVNRLLSEIRFIVSWEMTDKKQDLNHILKEFEKRFKQGNITSHRPTHTLSQTSYECQSVYQQLY